MTNQCMTIVRHLVMLGSVVAGICCTACGNRIYDLDQSASVAPKHGRVVRYSMDQQRLYWLEEYQWRPEGSPWENLGYLVMGCEKRECSATRRQYADMQTRESTSFPPELAVRNGIVYWTESHGLWSIGYTNDSVILPDTETIWRLEEGQAEPERLFDFPGTYECNAVALDDNELYCAGNTGSILALSLSSDPFPRVIAPGQSEDLSQMQFLAHGDYLYWVSSADGIKRTRKDGSIAVGVVATSTSGSSLAIDDDYLYWTDTTAKALSRCSPANCAGTLFLVASPNSVPASPLDLSVVPHSLQVEAGSLYWLEGGEGSLNALRRCSIDGCPDGPELVTAEEMYFYAVDETDVYGVVLADAPGADGGEQFEIRRFPL